MTDNDLEELAGRDQMIEIDRHLPLPGRIEGYRTTRLEVDLEPDDYLPVTGESVEALLERAGISAESGVDRLKAVAFFREHLRRMGVESRLSSAALKLLSGEAMPGTHGTTSYFDDPEAAIPNPFTHQSSYGWVYGEESSDVYEATRAFAKFALEKRLFLPSRDAAGRFVGSFQDIDTASAPALFLIERYAISSFLGTYGAGRTVRTFTLLPGEETTIRVKHWQSTTESIKEASSIVDSHDQSAKDRFTSKVQAESTDKVTRSKNEKWAVEAKAGGSWGWGSASVKGTASGEYQTGRERFARQLTDAVSEHAREASSKRELSITSSTERSEESGFESVTERVISNVNMRRVLNFVFRELNQEYFTKVHLVGLNVGFTTGNSGVWREVPISQLGTFLTEVVKPKHYVHTAIKILQTAHVTVGADGRAALTLESVDFDPSTGESTVDADVDTNEIEAPDDSRWYRFRQGPINQAANPMAVDGVLMSESRIVMRTDSVIVDVLLGANDALDSFAMEIQEAAAQKESLANDRERLLQATLTEIVDPMERGRLAAELFRAVDASGETSG
ncbi:MAG: hypothetical protein AAF962_16505 [Actinomycetota bacterium]